MKKKGMELSINFIIVLILSIIIFTFGLILFRQLFGIGKYVEESLAEDTEQKIMSYLNSGERVAVPVNTREIEPGDSIFMGIGVLNALTESKTFDVKITLNEAYRDDKTKISASSVYNAFKSSIDNQAIASKTLNKNGQDIFEFPIKAPQGLEKGTYIINLEVCYGSTGGDEGCGSGMTGYGNSKIYIKVT